MKDEFIIVSNRLPVERTSKGGWRTSPGGLVTALHPVVQEMGGMWIGWPGNNDPDDVWEHDGMRLASVSLSEEEVSGYYEGFSNATLWPLYHDVIVHPQFHRTWWSIYRSVNERFAARVAELAAPGAFVWVHDYQLQLVPELLRNLRPDLTIGFFLHIPFPAPVMFAQLPWRSAILRGMLGADLVGFQRSEDAAHFRSAAQTFVGATLGDEAITHADGREVQVGAFPISIDSTELKTLAASERMQHEATKIRETFAPDQTILLGIDRLDYTKGILHRLKSFEELLADGELDPREAVLIQVASPSREGVREYQDIREEVEATVGRINGTYGTLGYTPVVYLHRGHSHEETVSLFLAANVLVVSSLRDGMNLVAKEYVACRNDEQGVLVLSEFAGAADELPESVLVNPHDLEGLKSAMLRAIHMPAEEQRRRMRRMRETVFARDVAYWTESFIEASGARVSETRDTPRSEAEDSMHATTLLDEHTLEEVRRFALRPHIMVTSDVDGTLSPIAATPESARILPEAIRQLERLQQLPNTPVILVSGRSVEGVSRMLRGEEGLAVSVAISGSHGAELAPGTYTELQPLISSSMLDGALTDAERDTRMKLITRVRRLVAEEPGVQLEEKPLGIAVHVRLVADRARAQEILDRVAAAQKIEGVSQRDGKAVREFSVREVDKGTALRLIRETYGDAPLLYAGDDLTDEDVFTSLRPGDLGIKVGEGDTAAELRVRDTHAVAAMLTIIADERSQMWAENSASNE